MTENRATRVAEIGVRLLDDAYLAWFSAEVECEVALRTWLGGAGAGHAITYFTYRAALDREEAAARDLERLWELCEPCREALVDNTKTLCE
jgi:hypothetical protein